MGEADAQLNCFGVGKLPSVKHVILIAIFINRTVERTKTKCIYIWLKMV